MNMVQTELEGVLLIKPRVFGDNRGYFFESFHAERYREAGIPAFVQDNTSRSSQNTLRGLHYQRRKPQGKLVYITHGRVLDVVVDIRVSSKTFGRWIAVELSDNNHHQLYIPPGFAHGFCVLSKQADFFYKCTDYYNPGDEYGILWNDPQLKISWPTRKPILSEKDAVLPQLKNVPSELLFK